MTDGNIRGLRFCCSRGCDQSNLIAAVEARGIEIAASSDNSTLWQPLCPVPVTARHFPRQSGKRYFAYQTATSAIWCRVVSEKLPNGQNRIEVWCYAEQVNGLRAWRRMRPCKPYPLYKLVILDRRKHAPILLVEDEETADAVTRSSPAYVSTTILKVPDALAQSDFSPFAGRAVFILPSTRGSAWALNAARAIESVAPKSITILPFDQPVPLASGGIAALSGEEMVGRMEPIPGTTSPFAICVPRKIDNPVSARSYKVIDVQSGEECSSALVNAAPADVIAEAEPERRKTDSPPDPTMMDMAAFKPSDPGRSGSSILHLPPAHGPTPVEIGPQGQADDDRAPRPRRSSARADASVDASSVTLEGEPPARAGLAFVKLPHDVTMDPRLPADALAVLAYRVTLGGNIRLHHIAVRKHLGIGKDRFYSILKLLRQSGYLTRQQTRHGGEYGHATEEVNLKAAPRRRAGYSLLSRSLFEQLIPAKSLGLYLQLVAVATNLEMSLSQLGARFDWSTGTTSSHLRALFSKALVERRQLRDGGGRYKGSAYVVRLPDDLAVPEPGLAKPDASAPDTLAQDPRQSQA